MQIEEVKASIGREAGVSEWLVVTQDLIQEFANLSGDRQWIHVDPERARRESPLGTTIAHGFLTLSLLPGLIAQCVSFPTARMSLNYGFERIRFVAPVPAGAQVRGVFSIEEVRPIEGGAQLTWRAEVELRDGAKPALSALWLTRVLFAVPGGG